MLALLIETGLKDPVKDRFGGLSCFACCVHLQRHGMVEGQHQLIFSHLLGDDDGVLVRPHREDLHIDALALCCIMGE